MSYLASVTGVAVDVERGEQGHEFLFISAPEAEFIKDMEEGGKNKQPTNKSTKAQVRWRRQKAGRKWTRGRNETSSKHKEIEGDGKLLATFSYGKTGAPRRDLKLSGGN